MSPVRPLWRIYAFLGNPSWPFVVYFGAFPVWWVLGLGTLGFLLMAVPLGYYLLRRRDVAVPRGFGAWLLFLSVIIVGAVVLWVPVPGLVPEAGPGRLLPWAYRLLWFAAVTVVMLFIGNTTEKQFPTKRIVQLMAWMFLITMAGGYAGHYLYRIDFPSILEVLLPRSIANNVFVSTQIHPGLAQIQNILGYESPRPMAPFQYANSWGANYGMLLPFFLLTFKYTRSLPQRFLFVVVLLAAVPPIIFSLNRGLWLGLGVLSLVAFIRLAVKGQWVAVISLSVVSVIAYGVLLLTPLWDVLLTRLENPHSNEGRSNLIGITVRTTAEYSPLIGFGSTRQRQSNFFSIAAGATADCHQCSPPQLGTQGTLWYLIFGTGLIGTVLFLYFIIRRYWPALTHPKPVAGAMVYPGLFFLCVLPVYDLVSSPLMILMIGAGVLWRIERQDIHQVEREPKEGKV